MTTTGQEIGHEELAAGMWICRTVRLEGGKTREEFGLLAVRRDTGNLVLWSTDRFQGPSCLVLGPHPGCTYRQVPRGAGLRPEQAALIEAYAEHGVYDLGRGGWVLHTPTTPGSSGGAAVEGAPGAAPEVAGSSEAGPAEEVQGAVAALVRLAGELGATEADVDELVYDTVHRGASDAYNSGERPELSDSDAFDAVHDDADERASTTSNGGLADQITALVEAFGERAVEKAAGRSRPGDGRGDQPHGGHCLIP
jgi:hypothetical protein